VEQTKEMLYEKVKDMLDRKEFEELVREERKAYGYLIDDIAAAFLVVDKLGRNFFVMKKIEEIEAFMEATVYAKIEEIGEVKKSKRGKVVNSIIADETGACILVLWDADAELVAHKKLYEGCIVKVINGYVKEGYYGLEINVGKWGAIEIKSQHAPEMKIKRWKKLNEIKKGVANIEGRIAQINPTKIFFTGNGERFVAKIVMKDESGEREIMVWDERVKELQEISLGEKIKILNAYVKNGIIHVGGISKILSRAHTNL